MVVVVGVPATVQKVTVDTILGTSAVVRWQQLPAGSDDDAPVEGYELWYAIESNPLTAQSFNASANELEILKGLTKNTRYEVKVRAISAVGNGLWSSPAYFKTARTGRSS